MKLKSFFQNHRVHSIANIFVNFNFDKIENMYNCKYSKMYLYICVQIELSNEQFQRRIHLFELSYSTSAFVSI